MLELNLRPSISLLRSTHLQLVHQNWNSTGDRKWQPSAPIAPAFSGTDSWRIGSRSQAVVDICEVPLVGTAEESLRLPTASFDCGTPSSSLNASVYTCVTLSVPLCQNFEFTTDNWNATSILSWTLPLVTSYFIILFSSVIILHLSIIPRVYRFFYVFHVETWKKIRISFNPCLFVVQCAMISTHLFIDLNETRQ